MGFQQLVGIQVEGNARGLFQPLVYFRVTVRAAEVTPAGQHMHIFHVAEFIALDQADRAADMAARGAQALDGALDRLEARLSPADGAAVS